MSDANIVLPALTSGQVLILWLVLVSAVLGLGYGLLLVRTVLRADPGPKSMTDVAGVGAPLSLVDTNLPAHEIQFYRVSVRVAP